MRQTTRALVRSLDFRDFAVVASGLYSTDASERAISESFKFLPALFPKLVCLLIDGHPELNPESLVLAQPDRVLNDTPGSLQLLDLAHCFHPLTTRFLQSLYLRDLVYLDISFLAGSIGSLVQHSLNPEFVPELRVLKVRHRELDDSTARILLRAFQRQLWSLDLSGNKLTDATIETLIDSSFSAISFRSDAHFKTEGKLVNYQQAGTIAYGPFEFISESPHSISFSHPERYLPDAPPYNRRGSRQEPQEWQVARSTGVNSIRDDSTDAVRKHLLDVSLEGSMSATRRADDSVRLRRGGITHLCLNGNRFTSKGIQKLLRCTGGRLEHFECDSPPFPSTVDASTSTIQITGLFGISHLLRPVFASNLRSVRLHHSVVTDIPEVTAGGLKPWPAAVLAEGVLTKRIRMAYPQAFVPDMNPRLTSLTLTGIPTKSIGPLIAAIIRFLGLASDQQHVAEHAPLLSTQRGSTSLKGLRHIRLELAPGFPEEFCTDMISSELDLDELLDPASMARRQTRIESQHNTAAESDSLTSSVEVEPNDLIWHSPRWEYVSHRVDASASWTGNMFTLQVWVGSGIPGPRAAVNEYMVKLRDPKLRRSPIPVMPHHIAAGVPSDTYIFHDAWEAMIYPARVPRVHEPSSFSAMRDVAAAIKQYRAKTKGTSRHWMGKLELVRHSHDI